MTTTPPFHPPLALHVVWHPAFTAGRDLAHALYRHLSRDVHQPRFRGLGIPVFFRSLPGPGAGDLPLPVPVDGAEHTAVVVLVDDELVVDERWEAYLLSLLEATADGHHRLFPVALSEYAYELHPRLAALNFIRLQDLSLEERAPRLLGSLTHELCRLLLAWPRGGEAPAPGVPAPVTLFISHAKQDAAHLAEGVRDYLRRHTALGSFLDTNDIPPGMDFGAVINESLSRAVVLAIQSDAYASREWCRREVLIAKRRGCPLVVVNAMTAGELRSFPYLGNTPTLCADLATEAGITAAIELALYETLKWLYLGRHLESLTGGLSPAGLLWNAAELLSVLDLPRREGLVVYPDPPLGEAERALLQEVLPGLRLVTPTLLPWVAP